jgi:hypothetical protein
MLHLNLLGLRSKAVMIWEYTEIITIFVIVFILVIWEVSGLHIVIKGSNI